METIIELQDKPVLIQLTDRAARQLGKLSEYLVVEMELYFSCLIRKRVLFQYGVGQEAAVRVADKLFIRFRPVMTHHCNLDPSGEAPPLTEFPLENPRPFVPKWLKLDYRKAGWWGEFGY